MADRASQALLEIDELPDGGLDAAAYFATHHLAAAEDMLVNGDVNGLTILMQAAGPEHDDWRRTLARDLARKYAPRRVNIATRNSNDASDAILAYLRDAPGVTGQYLQAHE